MIFAKIVDSDTSHYVLAEVLKMVMMVAELSLYTSGTSPGYIIIIDLDGFVFGHLAHLSPMVLKKFIYFMHEAMPLRVKGVHFINKVPFMDIFLNIFKPFMKKEFWELVSTKLFFVLHIEKKVKSLYLVRLD